MGSRNGLEGIECGAIFQDAAEVGSRVFGGGPGGGIVVVVMDRTLTSDALNATTDGQDRRWLAALRQSPGEGARPTSGLMGGGVETRRAELRARSTIDSNPYASIETQ